MTRAKSSAVGRGQRLVSVTATLAWQEQKSRREPQFENEHVKVWKSIILPNQPLSLHRHEHGRALIALKGGTLKVVDEAGKTIDTYVWEDGKAYWLDKDPPGNAPWRCERRSGDGRGHRRRAAEVASLIACDSDITANGCDPRPDLRIELSQALKRRASRNHDPFGRAERQSLANSALRRSSKSPSCSRFSWMSDAPSGPSWGRDAIYGDDGR